MYSLQLTENEHSALINCLTYVPGISCSLIMYLSDVDECTTSSPCLHGGTCNNTAGSYECFCTPQWNGTNCDEGIYLFIFWGVNHGYTWFTSRQLSVFSKRKIIMLVTGKLTVVTKYCMRLWYNCGVYGGVIKQFYCLLDVDECTNSSKCLNGGTCNNTVGSYECMCTPQWNGTNCNEGTFFRKKW